MVIQREINVAPLPRIPTMEPRPGWPAYGLVLAPALGQVLKTSLGYLHLVDTLTPTPLAAHPRKPPELPTRGK